MDMNALCSALVPAALLELRSDNVNFNADLRQSIGQIGDVTPQAANDVWRVLPGQHQDTHSSST
jgi:hypothetical protein